MNKAELVERIKEKTGFSVKDTDDFLKAFTETIEETLLEGDKIVLFGFGTFEVKKRGAREGVNPFTGKAFSSPETTVPSFKFGQAFKKKFKSVVE